MAVFSLRLPTFDEGLPIVTAHFAEMYCKWAEGDPSPRASKPSLTTVNAQVTLPDFRAFQLSPSRRARKWRPYLRADYELHGTWRTPAVTFGDLPEVVAMQDVLKSILGVNEPKAVLHHGVGLVASGTVNLFIGDTTRVKSPPCLRGTFTLNNAKEGRTLLVAMEAFAAAPKA
jgi:hypothetical protein